MNPIEKYIQDEIRVMEKECLKKGISPKEWIERYAKNYCRTYRNASMPKFGMLKRKEG